MYFPFPVSGNIFLYSILIFSTFWSVVTLKCHAVFPYHITNIYSLMHVTMMVILCVNTAATGWSGDRIPVGGEIFCTCPHRPWGPPSLLYNGYRVFPGVKSSWGVTLTPHPLLVPWSWKSRAIPLLPLWTVRPVQTLSACTRVHFTYCSNCMWFFVPARLFSRLNCWCSVWWYKKIFLDWDKWEISLVSVMEPRTIHWCGCVWVYCYDSSAFSTHIY
jgi:hypothetical protein